MAFCSHIYSKYILIEDTRNHTLILHNLIIESPLFSCQIIGNQSINLKYTLSIHPCSCYPTFILPIIGSMRCQPRMPTSRGESRLNSHDVFMVREPSPSRDLDVSRTWPSVHIINHIIWSTPSMSANCQVMLLQTWCDSQQNKYRFVTHMYTYSGTLWIITLSLVCISRNMFLQPYRYLTSTRTGSSSVGLLENHIFSLHWSHGAMC